MTSHQPGDVVDIAIRGARVDTVDCPGDDTFLSFIYGPLNHRSGVRLGAGVTVQPSTHTADGALALLSLVERFAEARDNAHASNASSDADWYEKRIAARDLLEQIRQQLDPDGRFAVCPACAQIVCREGAGVEPHRTLRGRPRLCDPLDTLETRLADAKVRRARAEAATSGRLFAGRTGPV